MKRWERVVSNEPVRKSELIQIEGTKKVVKGQNNFFFFFKKGMSIKELTESMTLDRIEWRKKIQVADPI